MNNPNNELQQIIVSRLSQIPRRIAGFAILLWCISLALPAFVNFGDYGVFDLFERRGDVSGWMVLLEGWLGPIAVNFGWFANIFWFIAIMNLMGKGRLATTSAGWAVILSLNTFTFEFIPNAVNGGNPIYGLGIGAAFWLIAIALTFVAATINEVELTGKTNHLLTSKCYLVGLIVLIGGLAIHDRVVGNSGERAKLNHSLVAFKRAQVCSVSPKPKKLIMLNGSLELAPSKNYFLNEPETFLKLGIPVVRKDGIDYFLENTGDIKSIKSKPASIEISAVLSVIPQIHRHGDHDSTMEPMYRVNLSTPEGVVGFDQIVMKQYVREYCPNNIEQLVKETLVIPLNK